ncbi:MAG: acyl-CoA dehydrogenase family protein [Acidobacteria bacterium]|nr:acyl-CoA dehydrogenase family protein [Acidobacteriota bacterium]
MDFAWSEEQLQFRRAVIDFARKELNSSLPGRDREAQFPRENWIKCARFGIHGLPFPEAYGGGNSDILTTMLSMEGLGYGCSDNGLIFAINAQMWSVQMPLLRFAREEVRQKYLPALIRGEIIGAHGMSEPDSGSDAYSLRTRARKVEGGYVLSGTKTFVSNGPVADVAVVFATVDPKRGMWGVSAFIVEMGTPGFSVSRHIDKMGLQSSPMGELIFEDCFIPEENRLGPEGAGANIFKDSMEWERACILGSYVGAMERQLERAVAYARDRRQFGQPIGGFQSVANRIVDMKVRLETARLLLYRVAWLKSQGKSTPMDAAIAKLYLSEAFLQSGMDAMRTYGGWGYTTEFGVERDLRDALGGIFYSGTSDIQRNIIARFLGL